MVTRFEELYGVRSSMGQHQAKLDNSGPSPPPIFGYEPGYGAYPLGNPPREVLAIQQSRKNGQPIPKFGEGAVLSSPGGFPFPPFQGRPVIPLDVSAYLANAPPFPKGPNEKKQPVQPSIAAPADTHIDIDFDIADLDVPCDPGRKNGKELIVKNDKPANFFMKSLLDIPSSFAKCCEAVPADPSKVNNVTDSTSLEGTNSFQETYYDEPANENTQPPPLPPRMTSLPQKSFFNPFGMLPMPIVNSLADYPSSTVLTTNAEEIFKKKSEDRRSEKEIVMLLASLIRLVPVLWAPKFSTKLEVQQVEDAWEEIGRKVGCSDVWPLQRMKIVWLTTVAKFRKSIHDKNFEYYKEMEFLVPVIKIKTDVVNPVRKPGRKSTSSTFIQEYEDDYIPPQKIRNIAFAAI
ncbi:unnamed protein product [Auanema sp. JU1783]|nr:unnamed protein product [Auanema sp. JU1783]